MGPAYGPPMSAAPAERILAGRYALTDVLGRGGMGVVWRATDQVLHRDVRIKELTFAVGLTDDERRGGRARAPPGGGAAPPPGPPRATPPSRLPAEGGA